MVIFGFFQKMNKNKSENQMKLYEMTDIITQHCKIKGTVWYAVSPLFFLNLSFPAVIN